MDEANCEANTSKKREQEKLADLEAEQAVKNELDRVFDHHAPPAHVAQIHGAWREIFKAVAGDMMGLPPTRERAMALTRLEEASFWTQATIARNHPMFEKPKEDVDGEVSKEADSD